MTNAASWTPLHKAIYHSRTHTGFPEALQIIKLLTSANQPLALALPSGETEAILAARFADRAIFLHIVHVLQARGHSDSLAERDIDGSTALHHLVANSARHGSGAVEMCRAVLDCDASDAHAANARGETALHTAAERATPELVTLLTSAPYNLSVDARSAVGATPVHTVLKESLQSLKGDASDSAALAAARTVTGEKLKRLLTQCKDAEGRAAASGLSRRTLELRGGYHSSLELEDKIGATAMHWACAFGRAEYVAALVKTCAPDAAECLFLGTDCMGDTPLHYLARCATNHMPETDAEALCEEVLKHMDYHAVLARNQKGFTALHVASACSRAGVVHLLLTACSQSIDVRTHHGLTPLHCVAAYGMECMDARDESARQAAVEHVCAVLVQATMAHASENDSKWSTRPGKGGGQFKDLVRHPLFAQTAAAASQRPSSPRIVLIDGSEEDALNLDSGKQLLRDKGCAVSIAEADPGDLDVRINGGALALHFAAAHGTPGMVNQLVRALEAAQKGCVQWVVSPRGEWELGPETWSIIDVRIERDQEVSSGRRVDETGAAPLQALTARCMDRSSTLSGIPDTVAILVDAGTPLATYFVCLGCVHTWHSATDGRPSFVI